MTKQLAPIELLAREYINAMGYAIMDNSELEQLRQAIIKDFVSKLEPSWFHHEESGEHIFMNMEFELPDETPLYDLSEWMEK